MVKDLMMIRGIWRESDSGTKTEAKKMCITTLRVSAMNDIRRHQAKMKQTSKGPLTYYYI